MDADQKRAKDREYQRAYKARNAEHVRALQRAGYQRNKEKRCAAARARRRTQPDVVRAYDAKWRSKNQESIKLARQTYVAKHKDEIILRSRVKYAATAETMRARSRAWYAKNRERVLARIRSKKYGLTDDQIDSLMESQGGLCAGCHGPFNSVAVDHDHATGAVRGLLCRGCNLAIGLVNDSPARLMSLAGYLRRFAERAETA